MKTLKPLSGRHIWYLLGIAIVIVSAFKGWEFIEAQLKESHPLNQGMLVYFDFDGNVADGSGRQSRAIIRKATYTDGKFGQGLLFKGDPASYVELPHSASLSNHDALTFAAWANVYSNMAWYSSLFYISSGEEPAHPGFKDRVFPFGRPYGEASASLQHQMAHWHKQRVKHRRKVTSTKNLCILRA